MRIYLFKFMFSVFVSLYHFFKFLFWQVLIVIWFSVLLFIAILPGIVLVFIVFLLTQDRFNIYSLLLSLITSIIFWLYLIKSKKHQIFFKKIKDYILMVIDRFIELINDDFDKGSRVLMPLIILGVIVGIILSLIQAFN